MKFNLDLVRFLFFSFFLTFSYGIINIDLKSHFPEANRSKFLLSLKLLQINSLNPSFLQEVNLHQQVIAQKRLATYYGDIGVGSLLPYAKETQTFKMLFDTGSCEFWIPSDSCNTFRCRNHVRFRPTSSFKEYNGAAMSIQYLSGKVQGSMAYETIHLGDLTVPNQLIGVATEVEIPLLDEVIWDGILGLAYPNANLRKQHIKPLFDNIIAQNILTSKGEKNQFAYYLGADKGAISFGGADMKYKRSLDEEFVWAPISEENYWTISLIDVRKEESTRLSESSEDVIRGKLCPGGCKAIIDTGTYLIYGPSEVIQNHFKDLTIDSCQRKSELPNLIFEFLSENNKHFELVLTPDDYVLQFKIDGQDDCVVGIGPDNEDSGWTLGQVFLKAFYSVFDRDNSRIGFVRANPNPPASNTPDSMKIFKKKEEKEEEKPIFKKSNRLIDSEQESIEPPNGALDENQQRYYLKYLNN